MAKIKTLRDARNEKLLADANREHKAAVKEARARVKYWEGRVKLYGTGGIHEETLDRMRARLAELEG